MKFVITLKETDYNDYVIEADSIEQAEEMALSLEYPKANKEYQNYDVEIYETKQIGEGETNEENI